MVYFRPCGTCSTAYCGGNCGGMWSLAICAVHTPKRSVCVLHRMQGEPVCALVCCALHALSDVQSVACRVLHVPRCTLQLDAACSARTWLSTTPPSNESEAKIQQSFAAHT